YRANGLALRQAVDKRRLPIPRIGVGLWGPWGRSLRQSAFARTAGTRRTRPPWHRVSVRFVRGFQTPGEPAQTVRTSGPAIAYLRGFGRWSVAASRSPRPHLAVRRGGRAPPRAGVSAARARLRFW